MRRGLDFVVAQAGPRIEGADVVERSLHGFDRAADGLGDFFVLLVLQAAQMLVDDGHRILQDLRRAVAVLVQRELRLVIAELVQQAVAQVAAGHARRVQLTHYFQSFLQIGGSEVWLVSRRGRARFGRGSDCGGGICRSARRKRLPRGARLAGADSAFPLSAELGNLAEIEIRIHFGRIRDPSRRGSFIRLSAGLDSRLLRLRPGRGLAPRSRYSLRFRRRLRAARAERRRATRRRWRSGIRLRSDCR